MSKIRSQQVVVVEIDANTKMGLEQQSDLLGKWHYPAECTSNNGDCVVDLREQTASSSLLRLRGIIDAISSRGTGTFLSRISKNCELFGTLLPNMTTVQFFSALRYCSQEKPRSTSPMISSQSASKTLLRKPFQFKCCGKNLSLYLRSQDPRTILYVFASSTVDLNQEPTLKQVASSTATRPL
ncbi:hypothetical protein RB195_022222 [Necator americanus]|uniref:Uncharacterized protein n=1 Tax=Necator americanus TaxID=51031 RepID=A0ABR1EGN5_NECAM